ncbi:hypothetical protein EJB05_54477 [Eragrostis curvula]|uniref:NB-ARC domain-containing protein n=1 Tax=Eragrostis curvula TaxID=38414 RepID=A0A5J9SMD0_9POAL|nr:hypothetical protein EJB05_54477 [Eragrostis curvula]
MMQAFLMVAHEERDQHKVLKTWVKQVRDVAYDAEDYLQEFSIHLKRPSWWRLPCTLRERRRIATKMKELRARVEDVSQRNLRYQLIKNTSSRPGTADELSSITAATIFGIDEARLAAKHDKSKGDLVDLINKEGEDLRVIAVWGTSGDLGMASIVNAAYENPSIKKKFSCRAWARVMHPFNPSDFVHSLVKQFRSAEGVDILLETEKTGQELAEEFSRHVNERSYLIVINDLSTFEEWNGIKICFPNNMKGSRIILCTRQVEVASLCAGQESLVVELKQLSVDQTIYAFYEKDRTNLLMSMSSSNEATTSTNNNSMVPTDAIRRNLSKGGDGREIPKSITRIKTSASALEESQLIGREREKSDIVKLISNQPNLKPSVISVWGMGGLGKTTLVKDVYQSQNLSGMFEKRACVTVMRPFILKDLLKSLVMQIYAGPLERKGPFDYGQGTRNTLAVMEVHGLVKELAIHLEGKKCFIVFDDLSSTSEWDQIIWSLPKKLENSSRIVVTTRKESIAKYCSEKQENIYKLDVLQYKDALDLFTRKIFAKELKVKQNRHSICTMWCCFVFPHAVGLVTPGCVVVPRGIWKMKALQRLGIVNLERGKVVLQEIRRLTNLRKLGVAGVNMKNSKEFCLALADLCNLESLLVWSIGKPGLQGCLDGLSSPPKNLQSLKLYGNLVKLPEWIQGLHDLVKLALRSSRILEHDAAMHVLGELPNLTIMRLLQNSFQGAELCLSFPLKAFPSLTVLEMDFCGNIKSVKFEERASTDIEETTSPEIEIEERASTELEGASCPKLELIQFRGWEDETNAGLFSGLASLLNLKEFLLQNNDVYKDDFLEDVQAQLAQNPSEPVLKRI